MADDNTIIEGSVKFRDGKKWKQRWCVMRRLSPVADCVQLQLYRSSRGRAGGGVGAAGGAAVASLSLAQFAAAECGFTLDKQSNTLALLCRDLVAVLAFETRERLLQWQVKVKLVLGEARTHVVVVRGGGGSGLAAGPARLHVRPGAAALAAGCPPKLLAFWELQHLRRYGEVDGRFCLEGGALCGRGEGLTVLVCERPGDVTRDFHRAATAALTARSTKQRQLDRADGVGSPSPVEGGEWEGAAAGGEDTVSLRGAGGVGGGRSLIERCVSCMSKLGALSRSSTAALTPGGRHFSPAWTMEPPPVAPRAPSPPAPPPAHPPPPLERPPRPAQLDIPRCACHHSEDTQSLGVGPYENYDVPRLPSSEVEGEYYDTPKRLRECVDGDLFKITRSSTVDGLIVKKPCGCLLRLGRRRRGPVVVEEGEDAGGACACAAVTRWAHGWVRRGTLTTPRSQSCTDDKENVTPEAESLYATVDFSRKTRRKANSSCHTIEVDEGPLAHYENLNFALSLEYYENAKDLLRRAGVTQRELDAIGARGGACGGSGDAARGDEYLVMRPRGPGAPRAAPAGYTPMSPHGFHTLTPRRPATLLEEKSASNPALCAGGGVPGGVSLRGGVRGARPRSSSADSSLFLDEVKEFEDSGGGSASSLETLRNAGEGGGEGVNAGGGEVPVAGGGARDSSSSNDSGVSCRAAGPPRRSRRPPRPRSSDPPAAPRASPSPDPLKSSSAEAEVPLLMLRSLRGGVCSSVSTSSGTSDMSDYIETLSLCSSHSSTDTPITMKCGVSTLRPRSGREYARLQPPAPAPPPPPARPAPPSSTTARAQAETHM